MTPDVLSHIAIICHDAGGANQLFAMLRELKFSSVTAYMEGPAKELWEKAFPDIELSNSLSEVLHGAETLITGTGWASNLEYNARKEAQVSEIYSIAVLDHWTSLMERFIRDGEMVLPDEIWVVDEYALRLAKDVFPSSEITLLPDFYAEQQLAEILPLSAAVKNELLYLLEPMQSYWGYDEPGEFQALRYFLERMQYLRFPEDTVIYLRPHPSDAPEKYEAFLNDSGKFPVRMARGNLSEGLSASRWVAGCQTYAMTLALKAGRMVYCSLPPWAPSCKLPHDGIIHVKELMA